MMKIGDLTNAQQRVGWIDAAKGLTTFLVVWGHLIEHYSYDSWVYYYIYAFHMPCFFFLSGYVFDIGRYNNIWGLIKNKFKTLIIPIYTFGLINMFIMMAENLLTGSIADYLAELCSIKKWICTLFLVRGSGYFFFWFLSALFCTEILMYLQIKYIKNDLLKLITSLLMFIGGYTIVHKLHFMLPADVDLGLFVNIFVLVGYLARKKDFFSNIKLKYGIISGISFLIIGLVNWYFCGQHVVSVLFCNVLNPMLFIIVALLGTYAMIVWAHKMEKNQVIRKIGKTSLVTYCMQGVINRIMYKFIKIDDIFIEIVMFICAIVVVMITTLLGIFIKRKMPFLVGKNVM